MKKELKILFSFVLMLGLIAQMIPKITFAQEEHKQIEATGQAQITQVGAIQPNVAKVNTEINISVTAGQTINPGDYIHLVINHSQSAQLKNSPVKASDGTTVGTLQENPSDYSKHEDVATLKPEENLPTYGYKIVFNDNVRGKDNLQFSLGLSNILNYVQAANRDFVVKQTVELNGTEIGSANINYKAMNPITKQPLSFSIGIPRALSKNGETVVGTGFGTGFSQNTNDPSTPVLKVGDKIIIEMPENQGIGIELENNVKKGSVLTAAKYAQNFGDNINEYGTLQLPQEDLTYRVIETSLHKLVFEVLTVPTSKYNAQFPGFKPAILDTSEKTIDYTNSTIKPFDISFKVMRDNEIIHTNDIKKPGVIEGTKLKEYSNQPKKGSVIVHYIDTKNNTIADDIVLAKHAAVGTEYTSEIIPIEGYVFNRIQEPEIATGVVKEGVINITYIYDKQIVRTIKLRKMEAITISHEVEIEDDDESSKKLYNGLEPGEGVDEEAPIEGTVFVLKQEGIEKFTGISDNQGYVTFADVPQGTYVLEEKEATEGYVKLTKVIGEITIDDTKDDILDLGKIYNKRAVGSIKVIKSDATTKEKLQGTKFELQKDGVTVQSGTTNADGEIVFKKVKSGTYQLVETQAKEGYVSNTTPQEVAITTNNETVVKEITNAKIKGKVRVLKADELDGTPLAGVTFELRKEGIKVQEGITNANGELLFNDVAYGTYEIVETKAKAGYVLNETPKTVDVHENEVTVTKEFTNNRIEGSLKVIKTDAEDHSKLEGVRFDLQKDGETIISKATNAEGIIVFENLEYGTYTLVEKYAKDGYVLNTQPQEVVISTNGVEVTKEITNTKIKGSIKVIKIDAEDSSKLEGVQFELRTDGEVVQAKTTDANGEIVFNDVVFGTYELVETKAKAGYELNSESQEVEIRTNGEVVEKVITNKKEPVKPEDPKPNVPEEPKKENPNPIKPIENGKPKENRKLKEKVDTNDNGIMSAMMLLFISGAFLLYRRKR